MGTGWYGDPLNPAVVRNDIRNAMRAQYPADVLHARFPYVPEDVRANFIVDFDSRTDERSLLIQRFAENIDAFWNEERDRSQSVLRRIWRLFR